jgi:hypothetical protein
LNLSRFQQKQFTDIPTEQAGHQVYKNERYRLAEAIISAFQAQIHKQAHIHRFILRTQKRK